jgi:hypothetical protein
MSSQHRFPARTFRPEPGEYADAQADLAARGKEMDAFLRACLRRLHRDPDRFLASLTPVWPGPRPRGRPPRPVSQQEHPDAHHQAPEDGNDPVGDARA